MLSFSSISMPAVRLMRKIKKNPMNAASLKMEYFRDLGVTEVFLEATPTTFITTVLFLISTDLLEGGLNEVLIGSGLSAKLFWVGYISSILSSAFHTIQEAEK